MERVIWKTFDEKTNLLKPKLIAKEMTVAQYELVFWNSVWEKFAKDCGGPKKLDKKRVCLGGTYLWI
jgi:hypothetical protein